MKINGIEVGNFNGVAFNQRLNEIEFLSWLKYHAFSGTKGDFSYADGLFYTGSYGGSSSWTGYGKIAYFEGVESEHRLKLDASIDLTTCGSNSGVVLHAWLQEDNGGGYSNIAGYSIYDDERYSTGLKALSGQIDIFDYSFNESYDYRFKVEVRLNNWGTGSIYGHVDELKVIIE